MSLIQKIPALQGTFDSSTKKFVDLTLPGGYGKVDLKSSYINVNVDTSFLGDTPSQAVSILGQQAGVVPSEIRVKTSAYDNTAGAALNARAQGLTGAIRPYSMCALIRHAELRSSRLGVLESLRNVDQLRNMMAVYLESPVAQNSKKGVVSDPSFKTTSQVSAQTELIGFGDKLSRNRKEGYDLRINLAELFDYCNNECYDSNKYGDLHIHLEMNFPKMDAAALNVRNEEFCNTRVRGGQQVAGNNPHFQKALDIRALPTNANGQNGGNGAAGRDLLAASNNVFRTFGQFPDLRQSPYYVGQELFIKAVDSQPATTEARVVISNIARAEAVKNGGNHNAANSSPISDALDITIQPVAGATLAQAANTTITAIQFEYITGAANVVGSRVVADRNGTQVASRTQDIQYNRIELVAALNSQEREISPYTYTTYMTEEDNYAATADFRRNYDIPPMTRCIYVMFTPQNSDSRETNIDNGFYRFAIDNEDVLGRDININSPLHLDLLNQSFTNSGHRIRSLEGRVFFSRTHRTNGAHNTSGTDLEAAAGARPVVLLAVPCDIVPRIQKLTLELGGRNAVGASVNLAGRHVLYYEQIKSV